MGTKNNPGDFDCYANADLNDLSCWAAMTNQLNEMSFETMSQLPTNSRGADGDRVLRNALLTVAEGYDRVRPGAGDCVREMADEKYPKDRKPDTVQVYVILSEPGPHQEFVEIEDAEGRSVAIKPTQEKYPGHDGLWRIGPLVAEVA